MTYVYEVEDRQLNGDGHYEFNNRSEFFTSLKKAIHQRDNIIECNISSDGGEIIPPEKAYIDGTDPKNQREWLQKYFWYSGDRKVFQLVIVSKRELK